MSDELYSPIIERILENLAAIEKRLDSLDQHQHQSSHPERYGPVWTNTTKPIGFASKGSKP
jgi:hypothetical protein